MREVVGLAATASPSKAWAAAKAASPPRSAAHGQAAKRQLQEEAAQDFVITAFSGSAAGPGDQATPAAPSEQAPGAPALPAAAPPTAPGPTISPTAAAQQSPPAVVEALCSGSPSPGGAAAAAEVLGAPQAPPARAASLHRSPAVSHAVRSLGPVAESSPAVPLPPLPILAHAPQADAAGPAPARSMSLTRQLSRKLSRGMSRLRASIRRRLRRADSPPVPRSRDLSGRTSPSSSTHLPAIPEGVPAAAVVGAAAGSPGADLAMAALGSLPPAAAAAVAPGTSGAGAVGVSPAAGAGVAAEAAAEAAAPASQASRASLVEVDLSEPQPAPTISPSRRRGLACACFAGGRSMQ